MMLKKSMFRKPKIELEGYDKLQQTSSPSVPDEMCVSCPSCKTMLFSNDLWEHQYVCPGCGHHFRVNARQRIAFICDEDSFQEKDADFSSEDRLGFPGYAAKLKAAQLESAEKDAVVTGFAKISGYACGFFVMEPYFMMGSMGTIVGEKITRLFEEATERKLPVIGYTVSGGARVQEGMFSLMQMAKTSGAVKWHSDAGLLYITILTNPTTGGVTASFGMEGDIILAEPEALIGFAGPRVIEQTMRQKLPQGFQRAEFLLDTGFVDHIVDRREQKKTLAHLLGLHEGGGNA